MVAQLFDWWVIMGPRAHNSVGMSLYSSYEMSVSAAASTKNTEDHWSSLTLLPEAGVELNSSTSSQLSAATAFPLIHAFIQQPESVGLPVQTALC